MPRILLALAAFCIALQASAWGRDAGDHSFNIDVKGSTRSYIVHVPAKAKLPLPVVIMLHGGGGSARGAMWETGWTMKADQEGFLAVFPNALARDPSQTSHFSSNPQLWNDGSERFYAGQTAVDDVAFIAAMLDDLAARYALDERRVFVTGFSNGASMSFLVAARLPQRIAALAPVAGALWFDPQPFEQALPLLYITGTADPLNLIEGGVPRLASGQSDKVRGKAKPAVRDSILKWGRALGCPATATSTYAHGVRREIYAPCMGGSEVVYLAVDALGHTWAGGRSILPERMVGKRSQSINATDEIWDFFSKHGRPPPN